MPKANVCEALGKKGFLRTISFDKVKANVKLLLGNKAVIYFNYYAFSNCKSSLVPNVFQKWSIVIQNSQILFRTEIHVINSEL